VERSEKCSAVVTEDVRETEAGCADFECRGEREGEREGTNVPDSYSD